MNYDIKVAILKSNQATKSFTTKSFKYLDNASKTRQKIDKHILDAYISLVHITLTHELSELPDFYIFTISARLFSLSTARDWDYIAVGDEYWLLLVTMPDFNGDNLK